MNPSALFIARPVATTLLTIAIALAGAIAYTVLPVSPLPAVDFPTISVNASLPGASPEVVASSIATPLERQFGRIAGISEMTSTSSLGSAGITMQFDLSRDIDGAARDVQAAINAARTYLPANLPANPTYRKVNPADAPIVIICLTSAQYEPGRLYDVASNFLQQRLSQIPGVGQVSVGGGAYPAVRVDVNPTQLNAYGLTFADVRSVLGLQNADRPRGQLATSAVTADIVVNGQLYRAEEYRPLVLGYNKGAAVRLADVADVTDSVQNVRAAGYLNDRRAVTVIVFRQPGANIIDTVDRIRQALPSMRATIPQGIETTIVLDRTTTIRASVSDVEWTLVVSVLLVIAVVFLFLRNGRATLIPAVAVPVSLIGAFAAMYLFGYSLDNLSLMALTIATGFVVDDAIVVMENISRHMEAGMAPVDAAVLGAREIGFTVLSITASLIAVFIPILLMGGIVGRLFREFAVVLSTAIVVSLVVSLTTTPMMCAHLLKRPDAGGHGRFYRAIERCFEALLAFYRKTLTWVLAHPAPVLAVLIVTIAVNIALIIRIPKGFFPQQDTGVLQGSLQGPQDASFAVMNDSIRRTVATIKADPAVADVIGFTGGGGASNGGTVIVALKPVADRRIDASGVINRLRPRLQALPVASVFLQPAQDLRIGGRQSNALYQYTIQSDTVGDLVTWGPRLLAGIRALPGLQDVSSNQLNGGLQEYLTYDRLTAARLGVTPQTINATLYGAFGQSQTAVIYEPLNQYYVILEVAPRYSQDPQALRGIYLGARPGGAVPLSAVTTSASSTTALAVNHDGLFPSVTVSFNLAPGMSLSDATAAVDQMRARLQAPAAVRGFFSGTLQAYQQSLSTEPWLILAAVVAVYIVLGVLYESLAHPLTILSTLPSASVGAILALMLFKVDLSIISIIGIVLLIGIVKKNAIMMIDFALIAEREHGKSSRDAIFEACLLRFRPILMTTMAALFGALPLAFGTGTGSELRRPLGITIVGGLIVSQLLTLYTTPVVYLYLDQLRLALRPSHANAAR
jgi:multidrug efflux pump